MSTNNLEETKNTPEEGNLSEVEKQRFDYAWDWFDYHAGQRMQLFNFFLIITGILANAYVGAYEKGSELMRFAISLIGALQAFGFLVFDVRSRELTRYAEDVLEKIEIDKLFPDGFSSPSINSGQTLGLLRRESASKMREGHTRARKWKTLLKMKVWIRSIEIIVGLVFLTGLVVAVSHYFNPQKLTTPNQVSASPAKQEAANANSPASTNQGAK